ncbi:MAG: SOS response-associated peptidase, partial [Actinobacteria bacterium]|nr:SOS response-associated peptidase [Actinomycetota bacterium]
MCGRFNSIASGADFAKTFDASLIGEQLAPNFNVAPTAEIYALISKHVERTNNLELSVFNWGLVPS